jgi:hypothetical protein
MIPADKTSKKGPRKEPPFVRFWKHVQIGVGDCWLWIGAISTAGYPKFAVNTGESKLRKLHSDGAGYRPLAKIFGISKTQAGRVVRRESWGHVS